MEDRMLRSLQKTLAIRKKDIGFYYLDKNLKEDMKVPTYGDIFRNYVTNMDNELNKSFEKVKNAINDYLGSDYLLNKNTDISRKNYIIGNIVKMKNLNTKITKRITDMVEMVKNSKVGSLLIKKGFKHKGLFHATRAFSKVGYLLNTHTMMYDPSRFKKLLSALDFAGDLIGDTLGNIFPPAKGISAVTSGISFAGGLVYDKLLSDRQKETLEDMSDTFIRAYSSNDSLNKDILLNDPSYFKKLLAAVDIQGDRLDHRPYNVSSGINHVGSIIYDHFLSSTMQRRLDNFISSKFLRSDKNNKQIRDKIDRNLKKVKKGRTRGIGIKEKETSTKKLIRGVKLKQSKPYSNVIDMYHNNTKGIKTNNFKVHHDKEILDAQLLGGQRNNSNKNTFTININGINKSTQEIMNEIVPEIKLRMKNISIA